MSTNNTTKSFWTAEEEATLTKNLSIYPVKKDAYRKTAEKINRTADACAFHDMIMKKRVVQTSNSKSVSKQPNITYYNGTTRKAQVIVNNSKLIVAKMDDVVITIEF